MVIIGIADRIFVCDLYRVTMHQLHLPIAGNVYEPGRDWLSLRKSVKLSACISQIA